MEKLRLYQGTHHGHLPELPFWQRIKSCGGDYRFVKYRLERPHDVGVVTRKRRVQSAEVRR